MSTDSKRFRIAFSFAGETRDFVEKTALILAKRFDKKKILYDKFHEAELARYKLGIYLPKLYSEQSELIVPVLCANYDQKRWTGWEWDHIYSLLTNADSHRVMLARFDYANADGLTAGAGFIELDAKTPKQFASLILERLAINEGNPENHYKDCVGTKRNKRKANAKQDTDTSSESIDTDEVELHKKLALELLEKSPAYLVALRATASDTKMNFADATEIVQYFSTCQPEVVNRLFIVARKALNKVRYVELNPSEKDDVFEAVTALYMLAAMCLVNAASKQNGHVVFAPHSEHIFCAIIATALFGGRLKILPDYDSMLPKPEYVFEVSVPAAGDYMTQSFERALYGAILQNNCKANRSELDSKELNDEESSALKARLESIREIDEHNLCVVVTGGMSVDYAAPVSNNYQIPTLFQSEDTANIVLGMTHSELIAKIEEFWLQLSRLRSQYT